MKDYITDRLRADADHLRALASNEGKLPHQGLKGRFRELLVDNLLRPWLPPYVSCGTGMIIDDTHAVRTSTQDDIVLFDSSLAPAILASASHAPDGVFLYNSVIARIEVKSLLTRDDIRDFVKASIDITKLKHTVQPGFKCKLDGCLNLLYAFDSDARGNSDPNYQIKRVVEVMTELKCDPGSGIVSMVCIANHGFWKIGESNNKKLWQRLKAQQSEDPTVWFVACLSSSAYRAHALRQGRDPAIGLEGGIGRYLQAPYEDVT